MVCMLRRTGKHNCRFLHVDADPYCLAKASCQSLGKSHLAAWTDEGCCVWTASDWTLDIVPGRQALACATSCFCHFYHQTLESSSSGAYPEALIGAALNGHVPDCIDVGSRFQTMCQVVTESLDLKLRASLLVGKCCAVLIR